MNLDDFPTAGQTNGATPLRNAAFRSISFMRVAATFNKDGKTEQAAVLAKFFQECAEICKAYIPEEETEQPKKRGGK